MLPPLRQQMEDTAENNDDRSDRKPDAGEPSRDIRKQAGPGSSDQCYGGEL